MVAAVSRRRMGAAAAAAVSGAYTVPMAEDGASRAVLGVAMNTDDALLATATVDTFNAVVVKIAQ